MAGRTASAQSAPASGSNNAWPRSSPRQPLLTVGSTSDPSAVNAPPNKTMAHSIEARCSFDPCSGPRFPRV